MQVIIDTLGLWFLDSDWTGHTRYLATYDLWGVALSYVFAVMGTYSGLRLAQQVPLAHTRWERIGWLAGGAVAMGGGVWSMHFIGMLSYETVVDVSYDVVLTALSAVPAILASLVALQFLVRNRSSVVAIIVSGVCVGAGIGLMHFTGMGAMRAFMSMGYDPFLFAVSIVVAVVLAIAALAMKWRVAALNTRIHPQLSLLVAAGIMGFAISGMHYTAMSAVTFYPGSLCMKPGITVDGGILGVFAGALNIVLIAFVVLATYAKRSAEHGQMMRAVINNSLNAIVVFDDQKSIDVFSPAAENIFGFHHTDMTGSDISTILPKVEMFVEMLKAASQSQEITRIAAIPPMKTTGRKSNGSTFPVSMALLDISTGDETRYFASVRDITESEQAEKAKRMAHKELKRALDKERQANQLQRDFVTMASHEFRTPLAIIDGGAQRILRRIDRIEPDDLSDRVTKIRGAVSRMQRLMESFLAAAKTELGAIELSLDQCDLRDVISRVSSESQILVPTHEIALELERLPETIMADPSLIGQVFSNLLSNATKYSPGATRVEITGWKQNGHAHVSVRDFGRGIPEDELQGIFGRFFRASTSSGIAGTGIGLNLSKHIVEQHGGSIDVESTLDEGSTFTVHLPIGIAECRQGDAASELDAGHTPTASAA